MVSDCTQSMRVVKPFTKGSQQSIQLSACVCCYTLVLLHSSVEPACAFRQEKLHKVMQQGMRLPKDQGLMSLQARQA